MSFHLSNQSTRNFVKYLNNYHSEKQMDVAQENLWFMSLSVHLVPSLPFLQQYKTRILNPPILCD